MRGDLFWLREENTCMMMEIVYNDIHCDDNYERSEVSMEIALFARPGPTQPGPTRPGPTRPGPTRPDRNANQTLISPELLGQSLRNQHHMIENFNPFYVI